MSRLTSAQIVALGDYLEPDFEPSTLTVPQLLGIFGFHKIAYPTQYTKAKLVQLFNDEIKPRSKKYKRERLKRENSQASDDGIMDGLTGKPITERKVVAPRRTSRRISRAPTEEQPEQSEPAAPKRRRSTAEPSLGGPSRRRTTKLAQPVLLEESEPEEEAEAVVRKVGRKKLSGDAGTQARRVSKTLNEEHDDSGWEDNNVFQSGAESSSPMRPSPIKPRARRSSVRPPTIKSRKSMSEPPKPLSEPPIEPLKFSRAPSVKPPESKFEPTLPVEVSRQTRASIARATRNTPAPEAATDSKAAAVSDPFEEKQEQQEVPTAEEELPAEVVQEAAADAEETDGDVDHEQVIAVSQRIAEGGHPVARRDLQEEAPRDNKFSRMLLYALLFTSLAFTINYKKESAQIGFCDTGTTTNSILEARRTRLDAILSCQSDNRTTLFATSAPEPAGAVSPTATASITNEEGRIKGDTESLDMEPCPLVPLIPLPHPDSCTPCPRHAKCTPQEMTCDQGYILHPHPLLYFLPVPGTTSSTGTSAKAPGSPNTFVRPGHVLSPDTDVASLVYSTVSAALDGLPGLGPVALTPRCVEDPRRRLHIGVLGKAVGSILASERGRRLCEGVGLNGPEGDTVSEAKKWGMEVEKLKDDVRKKTPPHLQSTLEDTFNEAVQQLVHWGGVFMAEDVDGKRYIAHRTPTMGWDCVVKVKAREAWAEWKRSIIGALTLILSVIFVKRRRAHKLVENERVSSLVQIALDLLRNQELAHHTDPVTSPRPYLSSLQLRDLVLQGEHSVSNRRKLWDKVERVVEGNVNVRTNLEEIEGGDEVRVWRWVGSAGAVSPLAGSENPFEADE